MTPLPALEHLIDEVAIADPLVLRPHYIPTSEAQYFFCAADAVVLPYLRISTSGIVPLA
jgi:hypothetical protein